MIEYQAQFLMLKRFEPSNFFSNRELVQFFRAEDTSQISCSYICMQDFAAGNDEVT